MPQAEVRSFFGRGVAARRAAVKRSGTAAHLAVGRGSGRRMRVITSLTSGWRGGCMPEATCDCGG